MAHGIAGEKVLVTGASGFVGRHMLRRLCELGAHVTAVVTADRDTETFRALDLPIKRVVLQDVTAMGGVLQVVEPRHVVHLNAYISLERSLAAVQASIQTNLVSTIGLLVAATEARSERFILMGSCEEYGQKFCPFNPALALDPNSPYGASKAAASAYARMFHDSFGLPTVVLRPSVIYGPGQSSRQLIPAVLHALAANKPVDVTAGRQTRDFVYIDDVVESILRSLTAPGVVGGAFNVGSGEVVSVAECLKRIEQLTGRTGLIRLGARPYAESERFHYEPMVDSTAEALGWRPQILLSEGLSRFWDYILQEDGYSTGARA